MCFSREASLVTGCIGVASCAVKWRRGESGYALFWLNVVCMQFVEAAIHHFYGIGDSNDDGDSGSWLCKQLNAALIVTLLFQPITYALFLRAKYPHAGNLLFAQGLFVLLVRGSNIYAGFQEDEPLTEVTAVPGAVFTDTTYCVEPADNGHLYWRLTQTRGAPW